MVRVYLIQDEHFWFPDKRSRQGYALSLASGQELVCHLQPIRLTHSLPCLILIAHVVDARSFTSSAQLATQLNQTKRLHLAELSESIQEENASLLY